MMSDQRPLRPLSGAIGLFVIATLGLAACGGGGDTSSAAGTTAVTTIDDSAGGASFGLVTPQTALELAGRDDVTVIDVRTPEEFAEGHIEGATNIDFYSPTFGNDIMTLDAGQEYAVYCRSGNRSASTTAFMSENGFDSIYELQGGIVAWESAGLPIS